MKFSLSLASANEPRRAIEVDTLEDLLKLSLTYRAPIIVEPNDLDDGWSIQVYDDYIE